MVYFLHVIFVVPFISVVIPAHNRNDLLKITLRALLHQTLPASEFEIIVVGYSQNQTQEIIRELSSDRISYFEIDSPWPDQKRNLGWKKARGSIIAFTDDDCIPQKDWLACIQSAFQKNSVIAGVEGKTIPHSHTLFYHATENLSGKKYPTCNLAVRKEWLARVNGFDEYYHFFREDIDLAFNIISHGGLFVFDPTVIVRHPSRKISWTAPLTELSLVKNDIRLYKKFSQLYREHFGFLCRGSWKQSCSNWGLFLLFIYAFIQLNWLMITLSIMGIFLFRFWVSFRNHSFHWMELIPFTFVTFIRDLLFPFYFIRYFLTVHPKK